MKTILHSQGYTEKSVLYIAFELGDKSWRLLFSDGEKRRSRTVEALNTCQVLKEIAEAKVRLRLPADCAVVSCYEAGWEGFWLARWLEKQGIKNYVLDSASIEVSRKSKHKKTDRVDAEKLMNQLLRYEAGERTALTVVRVPSDESEDLRHLHRERDVLVKERGRHWVRIKSLLRCQGLRVTSKVKFVEQLQHLRAGTIARYQQS